MVQFSHGVQRSGLPHDVCLRITEVCEDSDTLKKLCLVHSSMRSTAQRNLFREICITLPTSRTPPSFPCLTGPLEFFTTNEKFASWVQGISFCGGPSARQYSYCALSFIVDFLPRFPNLRRLKVSTTLWVQGRSLSRMEGLKEALRLEEIAVVVVLRACWIG